MAMKSKSLFLLVLGCLCGGTLLALDDAEFWNLGFSADSRYVCFGQYWVDSDMLVANAEVSVVDVARNVFVPNGTGRLRGSIPVSIGSNGRNAVVDLIRTLQPIVSRHAIQHINQGRIIYLNIDDSKEHDAIDFKDFQTDDQYSVRLIERVNSSGAAFHIRGSLTRTNGTQRSFSVGAPDYYRPNVLGYDISQIVVAPNDRNYIFVIKQRLSRKDGAPVTRYMLETLSIDQ